MLDKENRLKKQKDFELVLKEKEAFLGKFLILKKTKNNLKQSRIGFVISKKVSKKAVVRNKIKRRIREIVRINLKRIKKGYDIIFFAKKSIVEKDYQEIEKEVEYLFIKAGLILQWHN